MNIWPPPPQGDYKPPPSASHPALDLAGPLDTILHLLPILIASRFRISGDLPPWLCNRIGRARRRIAKILALLAAGRLPRIHAPRPGQKGGPKGHYFSRRRAWLVITMGYTAAAYASHLEQLLRDPATLATLAAAPPATIAALARTLRPLCRLLGTPLPAILQPPPRPATLAKPPRAARTPLIPPTLPPLLPLHPQRRPRPMPFLRPPPTPRPA